MNKRSKILSLFISFSLAFSLMGVPAYAAPVEEFSDEVTNDIQQGYDSSNDAIQDNDESKESSDTESSNSLENGNSLDSNDFVDEESSSSQNDQDAADETEFVNISAADAVEFVYIDEAIVAIGSQQNIAIGFVDNDMLPQAAQLELCRSKSSESIFIDAAASVEGAVLFTFDFQADDDADAYDVVSLRFRQGDDDIYIALDSQSGSYMFDVVTQDLASSIAESDRINTEDEVSAYAIDGEGQLIATSSVQEAIDIADSEGVQAVSEGDSVIDLEAIENGALTNPDYDADSSADAASTTDAPLAISSSVEDLLGIQEADAAIMNSREDYLIVALDPGHGGDDGGASGYGLYEKYVNLSISQYTYEALKTYTGVYPFMTRTTDEYVGLQERVYRAIEVGADIFVCQHNNASNGSAYGAEVWVPNYSSYLYNETHVVGAELGEKILDQLTRLGLYNRGVKVRDCTNGAEYPDGSLEDYYTVIATAREEGIPAIIVEHAFIDNADDAAKLSDENFLRQLGEADAAGVANQYSLAKDETARASALVQAVGHTSYIGWLTTVYDGKVVGTTGKSRGLEAFKLELLNDAAASGGITYRAYVGDSWQDWASDGAMAGTTGQSTALQAIQIKLTGDAANLYDVYYRAHVANIGWLGWTKNGASAGSTGYGYNCEAIEVVVVEKGAQAPGDTTTPFKVFDPSAIVSEVIYQAHVANVGWQYAVSDGSMAGTTGQGNAIEALRIKLNNEGVTGSIEYNLHCADIGWQGWRKDNVLAGTTGESRQTEAIQIRLSGDVANYFDVYYRVHCQDYGWLDWAKNGEIAGTMGYGLRMEAIQIQLVEKDGEAPGATDNPSASPLVGYSAHVADIGWQESVLDGELAGTTGMSKAIEAITVYLPAQLHDGSIRYKAHVAEIGWQDWVESGAVAGTTGRSLPMEAVRIELTGDMADYYDVYYRVHSQDYGWLDWAKNGAIAGTVGFGKRMEAFEVVLVEKDGEAPGATLTPSQEYVAQSLSQPATESSIMGASQATVSQMVAYYNSTGHAYPWATYSSKGAATIEDFCQLVYEEATAEGVRAEVLFCQAMYETGWLQFGGSVQPYQCNFGGIGAVDSTVGGAVFPDVRTGLRAQVQHLKAYASTDSLNNPVVDPRFDLVTRGIAPNLEDLNGRWAVPGTGYGERILGMITTLLNFPR